MVSEWSIADFIMVKKNGFIMETCQNEKFLTSLVIYYEQMNNCELTDGSLADYCGTIVIAGSGPKLNCTKNETPYFEKLFDKYCPDSAQ